MNKNTFFIKQNKVIGHNGKMWGNVSDGCYYTVRGDEHFCYKYGGYGIQKDLFDCLENSGINQIAIMLPLKTYTTDIEVWKRHGIIDCLRKEDGIQIFLPSKYLRAKELKTCRSLDDWK